MSMPPVEPAVRRSRPLASVLTAVAALAVVAGAAAAFPDPRLFRAAAIAGMCLVLWLSELVPLYATTLLLWVGIATFLGPLDPKAFSLPRVLSAAANPVMALFFGGFALSVAGAKYGIDAWIAGWMVRASRGRRLGLLLAVMAATAVLSMWMSNIAAGAMMLATLRPLFGVGSRESADSARDRGDDGFRKALILGVAFAADFGGIATPIGTGPNLIAIGAVSDRFRITFVHWMLFAVPLAMLMLALAFALLAWRYRVAGQVHAAVAALAPRPLARPGWIVVTLFCVTVTAWLTEPLHRVPAAVTALAAAAALFASRLLDHHDLSRLEWDTLLLIAGGLTLGELFQASGLAAAVAGAVHWNALPHPVLMLCLVGACAGISAVASNTAAAAMLVQIGLGISPEPSVAVLVALGASMGVPFVISTPPNSMAYGQGGLSGREFFVPGVVLMIVGCVLVATTGPTVLRWVGIP
jgi:solute carrier family 13 (sodium-dependent dicarboxylate transporter), member 2/3/5